MDFHEYNNECRAQLIKTKSLLEQKLRIEHSRYLFIVKTMIG